jgi:hypothetical protein
MSIAAQQVVPPLTAMKQALEALEFFSDTSNSAMDKAMSEDAIKSLRQAIAELESQEPMVTKNEKGLTLHIGWNDLPVGSKLYTHPPQRTEQEPVQEPKNYRHIWGKDGEGCVICGDKDWMNTSCKPLAPQRTEQNFCSRCGKRTADLTTIHTCTPPQD